MGVTSGIFLIWWRGPFYTFLSYFGPQSDHLLLFVALYCLDFQRIIRRSSPAVAANMITPDLRHPFRFAGFDGPSLTLPWSQLLHVYRQVLREKVPRAARVATCVPFRNHKQ